MYYTWTINSPPSQPPSSFHAVSDYKQPHITTNHHIVRKRQRDNDRLFNRHNMITNENTSHTLLANTNVRYLTFPGWRCTPCPLPLSTSRSVGDAVLVLLSMVSRCDVGFDAVVGLALAVELFGCLCDRVSSLRGEISGGFTPYKCPFNCPQIFK